MRKSKIKQKLRDKQPALGVQLHLADPAVYEMTSLMGFDAIWMDLEHHGVSAETAGQLMRAARVGGADIVARPAKGEFMRMGRLLELGAQLIMYPRCDDPEEAAEVVKWAKFAPLGARGFDGSAPDSGYMSMAMTDYLEHANRETLVCIQVEHQRAVDQVEAIAATPGVDMVMLGPADYSILSGIAGQFSNPRVWSALEKVGKAAANAGKGWAATVAGPEHAKQLIDLGCNLVFHGADILMVRNGLLQMQEQFGQIGFAFDNRLPCG